MDLNSDLKMSKSILLFKKWKGKLGWGIPMQKNTGVIRSLESTRSLVIGQGMVSSWGAPHTQELPHCTQNQTETLRRSYLVFSNFLKKTHVRKDTIKSVVRQRRPRMTWKACISLSTQHRFSLPTCPHHQVLNTWQCPSLCLTPARLDNSSSEWSLLLAC